jgi:signal transduction histidine kinase
MSAALRILHLEDDARDAELVQGVLESGGIASEVTRVDTRADFAAALERNAHDLILADFSLPSFDGLSALKLAVEKRPELPFIFVSGTLGEEVAIEAMKIGATDYVLKERLSRIVSSVTRALREAREHAERKQAEEELRTLERRVRRAEHLESLGTLAGGIAHDFNNILGAILGYGEMALRDAAPGTRLRRDLDNILAAGERGRTLVNRVLAFSQSGAGEREPVHVEEVVREALELFAGGLAPNVRIETELRAGRAAMLGDPTQVHQVVMNLAANAAQAMPKGGVLRVSLRCARFDAPRAATVGRVPAGEYLVLAVADTGTGIHAEVLERMFDPFFTTKEVGVGSGLGLSLVHGIANSVGGAIDVATELGKGSTFTVYLPRSGDVGERGVEKDLPLPRGDGQRVLIVDDEEPLVRLASETLEGLGYAPVGFTSSLSALREFGANPQAFDAILTDERMPGVTGSTIIWEVRRMNPSIPILLMTGYVGAATALRARELGANDVLKKPLLARDLATSLARALQL